jgi:hypothetical protein
MLYAYRASSGIAFLRSYRRMSSLSLACRKAAVTPFPVIGSDCEAASPMMIQFFPQTAPQPAALEGCHRGRLGQATLYYRLESGDLGQLTEEKFGSCLTTGALYFDSVTGRYITDTVDSRPNRDLPDPLHLFGGISKRVKSSTLDLFIVRDVGPHRYFPRAIADRRKVELAAEQARSGS